MIIGILAFQEVLFRAFFPLPEYRYFNRSNYTPKTPNIRYIPPMRYEKRTFQSYPDTLYDFIHQLNGYGFRDEEWKISKSDDKKRIMFIGDSFLEGAMVSEGEHITDIFDDLIGSQAVETMNMGIIGTGLPEYINLLNDAVPLFQPDFVVLVLFSNDISNRRVQIPQGNLQQEVFQKYIPRVYDLIKMFIKDEPLPFRWQSPQPFMPAVPDPMNMWTTREDELSRHVTKEMADFMKAGMYNIFRINYAVAEEKFLKETVDMTRYFSWIKETLKKSNSKFAVCYIPSRHQVTEWYYPFELPTCQVLCPPSMNLTTNEYQAHQKMLKKSLNDLNIPFYDFTNMVKLEESKNNHLYWHYDDHMNEKGYRLIGTGLFNWWEKSLSSIF